MTARTLRCLLLLGLMLLGMASTGRAVVPAGFSDTLIANVGTPTALAFTPDGRMLIANQGGTLWVWAGTLLPSPALTIPASSICTNANERGLLGVAVDPAFAMNRRVYLFYTANDGGCVNRVSRFTFFTAVGQQNQVDPASELVLIDNMPSTNGNHNGGDLHFGKDGYLYASIGEGGVGSAARNEHVLSGKILRITPDGGIPPTNPFQGPSTARCNVNGSTTPGNRCQETFAWGFRNPFRFAMDPNTAGTTTRFFINDVGQSTWEEIDEAQAGADYGWNCREGAHNTGSCSSNPSMVDPIFEYPHGTPGPAGVNGCNSITGGAFVPNGLWPGFDSSYLFSDFICRAIFKLTQAGTWSASTFATSLGAAFAGAIDLDFGPWGTTQALYYTTFAGGGQVRRISRPVPRPSGPLDFHTVEPCRVADTRNAFGLQGGPALAAGTTRTFQAAGLCGISATASAVQINVTVVSPSSSGFLRIDPGDGSASITSAVTFAAGQTRSNNAVAPLGTAGDMAVTASIPSGSAHVAIDVTGYFE